MEKEDLLRIKEKIIKIILEDELIKDEMDRVELSIIMNTFFNNYERDVNILRRNNKKW